MEAQIKEEIQKQYVEGIYSQYSKDKKVFCESIYYKSLSQIALGNINIHLEIMDTVDLFLNKSREESLAEERAKRYREISFELRKIAQKIYNTHDLTEDGRFLKLVS
jgi:hypothetical protein